MQQMHKVKKKGERRDLQDGSKRGWKEVREK